MDVISNINLLHNSKIYAGSEENLIFKVDGTDTSFKTITNNFAKLDHNSEQVFTGNIRFITPIGSTCARSIEFASESGGVFTNVAFCGANLIVAGAETVSLQGSEFNLQMCKANFYSNSLFSCTESTQFDVSKFYVTACAGGIIDLTAGTNKISVNEYGAGSICINSGSDIGMVATNHMYFCAQKIQLGNASGTPTRTTVEFPVETQLQFNKKTYFRENSGGTPYDIVFPPSTSHSGTTEMLVFKSQLPTLIPKYEVILNPALPSGTNTYEITFTNEYTNCPMHSFVDSNYNSISADIQFIKNSSGNFNSAIITVSDHSSTIAKNTLILNLFGV